MAGLNENSMTLDDLSREVPESAVGPELTDEQKLAKAVDLAARAIRALTDIDEKLNMIARGLAGTLPDVLKGAPLGDAVDTIADLKVIMDNIGGDGGSVAAVKAVIAYGREVTMPERLTNEKVKTFNTERFRVTKTAKIMASVNSEYGFHTEGEFAGQPKAWDWLRENGYESLIKPTVNASSLSAAAKELLENGKELPEEQFKVHTKDNISVTKKRS